MTRLEAYRDDEGSMVPHHILVLDSDDVDWLLANQELTVRTAFGGNVVIAWAKDKSGLAQRFGVTQDEVDTGEPAIDFEHESC